MAHGACTELEAPVARRQLRFCMGPPCSGWCGRGRAPSWDYLAKSTFLSQYLYFRAAGSEREGHAGELL